MPEISEDVYSDILNRPAQLIIRIYQHFHVHRSGTAKRKTTHHPGTLLKYGYGTVNWRRDGPAKIETRSDLMIALVRDENTGQEVWFVQTPSSGWRYYCDSAPLCFEMRKAPELMLRWGPFDPCAAFPGS